MYNFVLVHYQKRVLHLSYHYHPHAYTLHAYKTEGIITLQGFYGFLFSGLICP